MKPYGKNGKEINCCPTHDSTSKQRGGKTVKHRGRQSARKQEAVAAIVWKEEG